VDVTKRYGEGGSAFGRSSVNGAGHGWCNIFRDVTMMVSWRPSGVQVLRAGHGWWTIFRDVTMMVSWRPSGVNGHISCIGVCVKFGLRAHDGVAVEFGLRKAYAWVRIPGYGGPRLLYQD
jgi:hypothetical protein